MFMNTPVPILAPYSLIVKGGMLEYFSKVESDFQKF